MESNKYKMRIVAVRLTLDDFKKFEKAWKKTTCRKLSDYHRLLILKKPVTVIYRNQSMDDFMAELIRLRAELNSIGNNFNQLVKKLHTTPRTSDIEALLIAWDLDKRAMMKQVEKIMLFIEKQGQAW